MPQASSTPRPRWRTWSSWAVAAGALPLLAAAGYTRALRRQEIDPTPDEQKIARTLQIVRTSTPQDRKVLKVLFYGQSITHSGWDKAVLEHWRLRYPNTVFVVENRALPGFASPQLLRTAERDIAGFYPDLIVFHVYGDHRAYEQIVRLFRSKTAADVIVQTDHGEVLPDPVCAEGLHWPLPPRPGCDGLLWVRQRLWQDEMSYHRIPSLAKKYGLALEPQRAWWREYLLANHTDPQSLLMDEIHPNAKGKELIAGFFDRYFDALVDRWNGQQEHTVAALALPAGGNQTVRFEGNRLELIASQPLAESPAVAIDGQSPDNFDGCYQATRTSSLETAPDWPALRRVELRHDHVAEDWTATVTELSADQKDFRFRVVGSKSGAEGTGDSAHDFVSSSGRLSIAKEDWMFERGLALTHLPVHSPVAVRWSVRDLCQGPPEAIDRGNGTTQYRYVLATGLKNQWHTATFSPARGGWPAGAELRAYRPPLAE